MKSGSDLSKPGKKILAKVTVSPKLVKLIISYSPEYTDTLEYSDDEKKMFQVAALSKNLSDRLFAVYLVARKIEGQKSLDAPMIVLPGG